VGRFSGPLLPQPLSSASKMKLNKIVSRKFRIVSSTVVKRIVSIRIPKPQAENRFTTNLAFSATAT
jgi:hypothetical protein